MPILTVTKTYFNGNVLSETDLDNIKFSIETFINTTKLDSTNLQISGIADALAVAMTSTGANAIAAAMTSTGAQSVFTALTTTEGYKLQGNSSGNGAFAAPNYVLATTNISLSGGTASSYTDITNATVTITARNRPIMLILQSTSTSSSTSDGGLALIGGASSILLYRGVTALEKQLYQADSGVTRYYPAGSCCFIDRGPGTGSITYKLQYLAHSGSLTINTCKLLAIEL